MKVAICEDVREELDALGAMLADYCKTMRVDVTIDGFSTAEALVKAHHKGAYDMILLDILMPNMSGMQAAEKIRQIDEEVALIFVTTSPDFAADSYFLNATFYLVKPITADNLAQAMKRCQSLIEASARAIEVTQSKRNLKIRLRDIRYIESHRNDCLIHTLSGEVQVRSPLALLENKTGGLPFLRCHQSFLVNLDWVIDMHGKGFVLGDDTVIPISKSYHSRCKEQFSRYTLEKIRS